jgi:hypothetical protein
MPRGRPFKCPYEGCESTNTVSKGARTTKSMGVRKIRLCKGCGRKFTPKNQMPVQGDSIETEATSAVEPEGPVPDETEMPELTNMQIPE